VIFEYICQIKANFNELLTFRRHFTQCEFITHKHKNKKLEYRMSAPQKAPKQAAEYHHHQREKRAFNFAPDGKSEGKPQDKPEGEHDSIGVKNFYARADQKPAVSLQLYPGALCETYAGDLAYVVGRVALMKGRPLLVEHVGGLFLIHNLRGQVMSQGHDHAYDISVVLPQ
jgi:hypothetical protein